MGRICLWACVLAVGCSRADAVPVEADDAARHENSSHAPLEVNAEPSRRVDAPPNVADLRTRKFGHDWHGFLGPRGDSKSTETGILTEWPAEGPRLVWHTRVGEGYSMPSVALGRLFHFSRYGDVARLSCVNAETGQPLWRFDYDTDYVDMYGYDGGPRSSPVIDGDRVYILGAEGMLHCLNVADGALVWKVDTLARFHVVPNFFGVGGTPLVEGELLIVQIGGSPAEDRRVPPGRLDLVHADDACVVAFDKRTGEVKYRLGDDLASYSSPVAATIGGRRWCFVFAREGLLGFDPLAGKVDFHYPWRTRILESVNAANPVVVDDRVFISEAYGVGSSLLKARPGGFDVVWADAARTRSKSMMTHWNTAVHHDGHLYGSSGRQEAEAELRCVELATRKVMWSEPNLTRSSLLYVDGHFVCLTENGELLLIRATHEKFDPVARVRMTIDEEGTFGGPRPLLQAPAWAAPILAHGLLYVRGATRLACLELIEPPSAN